MKKTKEYKISIVIFCIAIALLCVAGITGVIAEIDPVIEKVCFALGFSLNCLGFVFLKKSEENKDN